MRIITVGLMALLATPAAAVTVTGISAGSGNAATVVTQEDGLLGVDFAVRASSPIRLNLQSGDGELGFGFNSLVDIFTAVENGRNVRKISLSLTGATFSTVGDVAPSFSGFGASLNPGATRFTIDFGWPGEPNAVLLGSLAGAQDFGIAFDTGGGPASLTLQAAVPEPLSWAMMILGFGLVGGAVRRTRASEVVAAG
jgi:hypothetical protein